MYHVPPKIVVHGDENKAAHYMGPAREFLRRLVHSMSFQDLKQLEDSKTFSDGTVIHCVHRFGESIINIYCPYDVPEKEEKEEEVIEEGTERKAHFFIKFIAYRPEDDSGYTIQDLVLVRHITSDDNYVTANNVLTGPDYWTRGIRVGDKIGDRVITGVSSNSLTFDGPAPESIAQTIISIYRLQDRVIQPDQDEEREREFNAAWVWFDRDQVYGTQTMVFFPGDQWDGDVAAEVPGDAVENVGAWHPELIQKIAGTLTTENFGGKAFELSYNDGDGKKQTNRYASYTGNVPLLFREGEILYKGAPCLDIYQDPDMPAIYMANMHKMIVQNGKHVAWYYFKQEPYFVDGFRGEMDMRFTVCTLDLVTIVGDELEIAVPTPRAKMRGGSTTSPHEGLARIWDVSEQGSASFSLFDRNISLAQWLSDWSSPWAGWIQVMQFPQGMQMLLDIKEIDPQSFADDSWVTLFMSESDSLAESRYYLHPDAAGDMGLGFGYSYGGYAEKLSASLVETAYTWVWTKDGWGKWDSLEFDFTVQAHRRWDAFGSGDWDDGLGYPSISLPCSDPASYVRLGLFGFNHCTCIKKRRYGGARGNGGDTIYLPWSGTIAWSLGFFFDGTGTGLAFEVFKKYKAAFSPFDCDPLQRYYRHGGFDVGAVQTGDGWVWGDPIMPSRYGMCLVPAWRDRAPFTARWQFAKGAVGNVNDTNNFGFLWHETYNNPWGTGCKMFTPNIFLEDGRDKRSADNSTMKVNSQLSGPVGMLESEFGAPSAPYWPDKSTCEQWYSFDPIPWSVQGAENPATWTPITGYMSGGGEVRGSSWNASDSTDETVLHCSDGEAAFTLPADAWEYYFMDDRSVTDEPQGVFLACKTATTWRFFHFWEGAGTIKEVTNEIWEGLGFDTPQERVSIQCIGVI